MVYKTAYILLFVYTGLTRTLVYNIFLYVNEGIVLIKHIWYVTTTLTNNIALTFFLIVLVVLKWLPYYEHTVPTARYVSHTCKYVVCIVYSYDAVR